MSRELRPPRFSARALGWASRRLGTPELAEDAAELFAERAQREGEAAARRWYRRQARAALARVLLAPRAGGRTSRAPGWMAGLSLDAKLGVRMLIKHPGLSLVSGVGIAVAVAIGTVGFGAIRTVTSSELPLDEGDRIVTVQNTVYGGMEQLRSTHLHDLVSWREEVRAFSDLGAYRVATRNLVTPDGRVDRARTIEMTASGFRIARVPPQLGRYLIEDDEVVGAQAVVVIGYRVWQDLFAGSPDVVGQTLQLGATPHTVVGVMPEGFAFPINNRVWAPLRLDPRDFERGAAPEIDVFARLAPGATLSEAQAQLVVVGQRAAATFPTRWDDAGSRQPFERLQPRIYPYTQEMFWGPLKWLLYVGQLVVSLLLAVVAINVAVLTYARTQTRTSEILVRTAIGASRSRIAAQLFAEALVLSCASAAIGLVGARFLLERFERILSASGGEQMPFWWDFSLSPSTVGYSLALAAFFALIIGVVPALGATGRHVQARLQSVGTSGSTFRLGWKSTALIVMQVAIAVAVLPFTLNLTMGHLFRFGPSGPDYATSDYLWASLELDQETLPGTDESGSEDAQARLTRLQAEVITRLEAEPQLSQLVAMAPAPWQDPDLPIEVEGTPSPLGEPGEFHLPTGTETGWSRVGINFLTAFGIPVLAGRGFEPRDAAGLENVVIVSQSFVDRVLGGGNAVGRRIRQADAGDAQVGLLIVGSESRDDRAWYTIVGVVPDFPKPTGPLRPEAKIYQPLTAGYTDRPSFAIRVRGADPARYSGRLRELVAQVDPTLRLSDVASFDELFRRGRDELMLVVTVVAAVSISVLLLSVAGLYALMSFTVLGRRREIGIRSALGARSHRILGGILSRAMAQLALGIAVGIAAAWSMDSLTAGGLLSGRAFALLPAVVVLMAGVGFLAAWGPARRVLEVQPTEALRN